MQANASRPISVRDVAQVTAIGERTLGRLFRQHLAHSRRISANRARQEGTHVAGGRLAIRGRNWARLRLPRHKCVLHNVFTQHRSSPNRYRDRLTLREPRAVWRSSEASEFAFGE